MTSTNGIANPAALDGQIDEVIRSAQRELVQLLTQRAELVKRIGTVKQTLVHMARLFGDDVLTPEVLPLLGRTPPRKQPGLTRACRTMLMRSEEHTSELQSPCNLVCRLLLEKKNKPGDYCIMSALRCQQ